MSRAAAAPCPSCRPVLGAAAVLGCAILPLVGCAARHTLADAFPPGSVAAPWVLREPVWSGSFDEAAPALGTDAGAWAKHRPTRLWLAVYEHEQTPQRRLKVRCFAFETGAAAEAAFEALRPPLQRPYPLGDAGAWTDNGVLFRCGRLVFDIFGDEGALQSQTQATVLATAIVRRMPRGAADEPR